MTLPNRPARIRRVLVVERLEDRTLLAGNLLVTDQVPGRDLFNLQEYTQQGSLLLSLPIQPSGGTDYWEARDLTVDPAGNIDFYHGTFTPSLVTYHVASQTLAGWNTVNSTSYGGVAAYNQFVFASDMTILGDANGIVRFDTTGGAPVRFGQGQDFIQVALGLDGFLYGLASSSVGNVAVEVFDPNTLAPVRSVTFHNGPDPNIQDIAVDASGQFLSASFGGFLAKYDGSGNFLASTHVADSLINIALDTDGQVAAGARFGEIYLTDESLASVQTLQTNQWNLFVTFDHYIAALPSAPVNLTAAAGIGLTTLNWNAAPGASSYNLYRSTTSDGETLVQSNLNGTSFTDIGLTPGTTYYYEVSAVNPVGEGPRSQETSAVPLAALYNNAATFSPTNNPAGVWSYGFLAPSATPESPDASTFASYNSHGTVGSPSIDFWETTGSTAPNVTFNPSTSVVNFQAATSVLTYQPQQAAFYPGPNGAYSVYRFTAPAANFYALSAIFAGIDQHGGADKDIHVLLNGSELDNDILPGSYQSTKIFSTVVGLAKGARVDFVVGFGAGPNSFDTTALSASLTPVVGPATHFKITGPGTVTAGGPFSVTVTALDAFNHTAPSYVGTIHFSSNDLHAVLPVDYTFVAGDHGTHTFSNSTTLFAAPSKTITVTDTTTSSITSKQTFNVQAAAAETLTVSGFVSPTTAGASHTFVVTAKDAFGNVATSYRGTVHLTSSDGQGLLPANYTFLTTDKGRHAFSAILETAGTRSITATDTMTASIIGSQSGIVVRAAAASILVLSGFPASSTAGAAITFTVMAKDAFGNLATGYRGTVHFTSSDSAAILPADRAFTSADAGKHAFSATLNTSGPQSISATDTVTSAITGTGPDIQISAALIDAWFEEWPEDTGERIFETQQVRHPNGDAVFENDAIAIRALDQLVDQTSEQALSAGAVVILLAMHRQDKAKRSFSCA